FSSNACRSESTVGFVSPSAIPDMTLRASTTGDPFPATQRTNVPLLQSRVCFFTFRCDGVCIL
ncbi:MAG: hypothetical protein V7723_19125, partial [Sneathiella sp.]|uniref:hypothetical protein n=1 Tax=Sneathiella sp. TaxID=1964365 RepID=UPI0030017FE4